MSTSFSKGQTLFFIEKPTSRQVERIVRSGASLFFDIPSMPKLKQGIHRVAVDDFSIEMGCNNDLRFAKRDKRYKLYLDRFGSFQGEHIDRLVETVPAETIRKAFELMRDKLLELDAPREIPEGAIDLSNPSIPVTPTPVKRPSAIYKLDQGREERVMETVESGYDIFFDVQGYPEPKDRVKVKIGEFELYIGPMITPYYSPSGNQLWLTYYGWFSEQEDKDYIHAGKLYRLFEQFDEATIREAFQKLSLAIIERAETESGSKKRKAPPSDPIIWTPTMTTEVELCKRLKTAEIKSESSESST